MNEEIDLRPFLRSIVARWFIVLFLIISLALIGVAAAMLTPPRPVGRADVLIVSTSSQVNLDPRFVTRDATLLTNVNFQRQALISLASSTALEQVVADTLIAQGRLAEQPEPGELLNRIRVTNQGDLLAISASGGEIIGAVELAETWARTYERLVAETYTRDGASDALLAEQLVAAEVRYAEAQAAVEAFVGRGELVQLEQQIRRTQELLDGSRTAGTALYNQYLSRAQELDFILVDAQSLREQITNGNTGSIADGLNILTLRARSAGGSYLPVQLSFADGASIARSREGALSDLDILIDVVTDKRDLLLREAELLAASLAEPNGINRGLGAAERANYEAQLTALLQRQEQLLSERSRLTQTRDIAITSLDVLKRKIDEQQIAQASPQISVRVVGAVLQPPASNLLRIVTNAAAGAVAGLIIGVILAILLDRLRPRIAQPTTTIASTEQSLPTRS